MSNVNSNNNSSFDKNDFIKLLMANQRHIQAFIISLVPNVNDAEDIYQDTASEMWNKYDSFVVGTDFAAWAITIAKFKVFHFYRKSKNSKLKFDSDICEKIASRVTSRIGSLDDHIDILNKCVRKLANNEKSLLKLRYKDELTLKQISLRISKKPPSIHRIISNIHAKLAICFRRNIRCEGLK